MRYANFRGGKGYFEGFLCVFWKFRIIRTATLIQKGEGGERSEAGEERSLFAAPRAVLCKSLLTMQIAYILIKNVMPLTRVSRSPSAKQRFD